MLARPRGTSSLELAVILLVHVSNYNRNTRTLYNDNNNNNRLYYLEFRAYEIRIYALSIIFYVQRYSYALLISLKCSWASDFDIFCHRIVLVRVVDSCKTVSVAAVDIGRLRMPRESFLFCPTFLGS